MMYNLTPTPVSSSSQINNSELMEDIIHIHGYVDKHMQVSQCFFNDQITVKRLLQVFTVFTSLFFIYCIIAVISITLLSIVLFIIFYIFFFQLQF